MNPKSEENWLSKSFDWLYAIWISLALACMVGGCFTGCAGTSHPHAVQSSVASFDENAQNSGFLGFDKDGSGIITAHAHARYVALIADYGYKFKPPLNVGLDGTTLTATNTFTIDRGHLAQFMTMQRWKKQGVK